jgi:hypothetical protein
MEEGRRQGEATAKELTSALDSLRIREEELKTAREAVSHLQLRIVRLTQVPRFGAGGWGIEGLRDGGMEGVRGALTCHRVASSS